MALDDGTMISNLSGRPFFCRIPLGPGFHPAESSRAFAAAVSYAGSRIVVSAVPADAGKGPCAGMPALLKMFVSIPARSNDIEMARRTALSEKIGCGRVFD